ncbi:MAG: hypothetical protein JSS76_09305 [Bacteroidetes bacterium]|nr:hypothetical protein [Bacteroidota bacterium]
MKIAMCFVMILTFGGRIHAADNDPEKIYGKWKVAECFMITGNTTPYDETDEDRNRSKERLLNTQLLISDYAIVMTILQPGNYMINCKGPQFEFKNLSIINGQTVINTDAVSKDVIELLKDKKLSQSSTVEAWIGQCPVGSAHEEKLEILFVNKKKLAVYMGNALLIITR